MSTVVEWLSGAGFERYAEAFAAQDITLDVLPELNEADLKELGVATLGDRKRLLKAIAALAAPPRRRPRTSTGRTPPGRRIIRRRPRRATRPSGASSP